MSIDSTNFEASFTQLCKEGRSKGISDLHIARGGPMTYLKSGVNTQHCARVPEAFFDKLLEQALRGRPSPLPAHDFNGSVVLHNVRVRVNAFFASGVPCLSLRLLADFVPSPQDLGVPPSFTKIVETARSGLILVTGPTNSGKSTTLASLINQRAAAMSRVIVTLEDPVEYPIGVGSSCRVFQRDVGTDLPSFKEGLSSAMRQSPDTILVGEIRDDLAAEAVLSLAASGHLVLSTFHTTSASQTVDRFVQMFSGREGWASSRLSDSLVAAVCQRLVPRSDGQGRTALFEVCVLNSAMRNHIRSGRAKDIRNEIQSATGCVTFERSIRDAEAAGLLARNSINAQDLL
jgi:twitching motility protein PilT